MSLLRKYRNFVICSVAYPAQYNFWKPDSDPHQSEKPDPDLHQSQKQDQNQNLWAVEAKNGATAAHPGAVEVHKWRPEGSPWSRKRACRPLFAELCTVSLSWVAESGYGSASESKFWSASNWKAGSGSAWKWSGSVTLLFLTLKLTKFYFTSAYLQGHNGRLMCCIWHPTKVSYQFICLSCLFLLTPTAKPVY